MKSLILLMAIFSFTLLSGCASTGSSPSAQPMPTHGSQDAQNSANRMISPLM